MGNGQNFLSRLAENLLIQLFIISGLVYYFRDTIKFLLEDTKSATLPLWVIILAVFGTGFLIFVIQRIKKLRSGGSSPRGFSIRTRTGLETEIPLRYKSLNWIAHIPPQVYEVDEYVWLNGPYCPNTNCSFELEWKSKKWHCLNCNKDFGSITGKTARVDREFVKNYVYAEKFRKNKFIEQ